MDAPLALYRRYRPETFDEVIGQEHVTEPLRQALRNNRVHHAYLFSGPRGCGKTTSARILARCLNCEQGPTPTPCGTCQSCTDLARGGPGSMDVIEIDAASHGGVDDARDLRERAFFAPVAARYKIYIVDEAHMVTPQGFNALLKLVEEPPDHLKFVFATTEPDKVIGTIRSRTHHYPFRLVPPKTLQDYLTQLCEREGVQAEPAVLPLVVRAGGGSVRDTLSVLDQLIGGAGPDGLTYGAAAGLLGYTPDTLLDETIDAFAARDAATVFGAIDRVIESGQDPKRFAEDLLHRLRDLVIVAAVPDAASGNLLDVPAEQAERLVGQAARFGAAELTRAADVVSTGLTDMRGATAPRLHLELLCARVLLPGADDSTESLHARLDRVERRLAMGVPAPPAEVAGVGAGAAGVAAPAGPEEAATDAVASGADQAEGRHAEGDRSAGRAAAGRRAAAGSGSKPSDTTPDAAPDAALDAASAGPPTGTSTGTPNAGAGTGSGPARVGARPDSVAEPVPAEPSASAPGAAASQPAPPAGIGLADIRRIWPEVLAAVMTRRRFTWIMLSQNAQVADFRHGVLTLALVNAGARDSFVRSGSDEILRAALQEVVGVDCRVEAVVDSTAGSGSGGASSGADRSRGSGGSPPGRDAARSREAPAQGWGSSSSAGSGPSSSGGSRRGPATSAAEPGAGTPEDQTPGDRVPADRAPADRAPGDRAPADQASGGRTPGGRPAPRSADTPPDWGAADPGGPGSAPDDPEPTDPGSDPWAAAAAGSGPVTGTRATVDSGPVSARLRAVAASGSGGDGRSGRAAGVPGPDADEGVDPESDEAMAEVASDAELLAREFGAHVIEERTD